VEVYYEEDFMNFRKVSFLVFLAVLMGMLLPVSGAIAGEAMYLEEPNFYSVPKTIMIGHGPQWAPDFRDNPALMGTDKDVRFLMDLYYTGSYTKVDLDNSFTYRFGGIPLSGAGFGSGEEEYVTNGAGADVGVVLKVTDRSELGVVMSYRYLNTDMEGDQVYRWSFFGITGGITSSLEREIRSSDFSLGLLYNIEFTPAFSLGMGLKYGRGVHESDFGLDGSGTSTFGPETIVMDRDLTLDYHRFAPVLGVSVKPNDALTIDASVEGGYIFGGVDKSDTLDSTFVVVPALFRPHSEHLSSRDLSGWDIKAGLDVMYAVSDTLSLPFFIDFAYMDTAWEVDGTAAGVFFPNNLPEIVYAPGPVDYENDNTLWHITAGLGADFTMAGWDTEVTGAYTHWQNRNDYDQSNINTGVFLFLPGATSVFEESVVEKRDIISLGLVMKKDLTPSFAAELGLRYDLGLGRIDLDRDFTSALVFIAPPTPTLSLEYKGTDVYQNLTLSTRMEFKPSDRLTLALGGAVTFPLDPLDYELEGDASGIGTGFPPFFQSGFDGPTDLGSKTTQWQYGGYLMLTYELGVPKPVPPATAPAPIIEPKLEPMSQK
jgi:hypothetical protein